MLRRTLASVIESTKAVLAEVRSPSEVVSADMTWVISEVTESRCSQPVASKADLP